jgi:hypothetical protein
MECQEATLQLSSAFRPNTDGQSERTNRFLEDYLRNYVLPCQSDWARFLYLAEIAYNSRHHESIGMAPFEADLGYIPRMQSDHLLGALRNDQHDQKAVDVIERQAEILEVLKVALTKAQETMKRYYDRNRPSQSFKVGDQVMLATKNLAVEHMGIQQKAKRKLGPIWIGPYPVMALTSQDTYRLQLPAGLRLYPEFHTSLLKPYHKDEDPERMNQPNAGMIAAGGEDNAYLIEDVVGHRDHAQNGKEVRVKWLGYPSDENTWEPLGNIIKPAKNLLKRYFEDRGLSMSEWMAPRATKRKRGVRFAETQ